MIYSHTTQNRSKHSYKTKLLITLYLFMKNTKWKLNCKSDLNPSNLVTGCFYYRYIDDIIMFYIKRKSSYLLPERYHKNLLLSENEIVDNAINFLHLNKL